MGERESNRSGRRMTFPGESWGEIVRSEQVRSDQLRHPDDFLTNPVGLEP